MLIKLKRPCTAALNFSCFKVIIGAEGRMVLRLARSGSWKGRSYRPCLDGERSGWTEASFQRTRLPLVS
jgi:hypothetical protein